MAENKPDSKVMSRTLHKAAELVGGHKNLARRLRVPQAELQKWIGGEGRPPMATFLKAVDIVLEETAPDLRGGVEEPDSPAPRDCASYA